MTKHTSKARQRPSPIQQSPIQQIAANAAAALYRFAFSPQRVAAPKDGRVPLWPDFGFTPYDVALLAEQVASGLTRREVAIQRIAWHCAGALRVSRPPDPAFERKRDKSLWAALRLLEGPVNEARRKITPRSVTGDPLTGDRLDHVKAVLNATGGPSLDPDELLTRQYKARDLLALNIKSQIDADLGNSRLDLCLLGALEKELGLKPKATRAATTGLQLCRRVVARELDAHRKREGREWLDPDFWRPPGRLPQTTDLATHLIRGGWKAFEQKGRALHAGGNLRGKRSE